MDDIIIFLARVKERYRVVPTGHPYNPALYGGPEELSALEQSQHLNAGEKQEVSDMISWKARAKDRRARARNRDLPNSK